jgi:Tetratricopeptide repeat
MMDGFAFDQDDLQAGDPGPRLTALLGQPVAAGAADTPEADPLTALRRVQAEQLNDAGTRLWKEGRYATAISILKRAIALAPELPYPVMNLGLALWRAGDIESAGAALWDACAMAPDDPIMHGNLGIWCSATGRYDDADRHLLRAQALAPGKPGPVWDRAIGMMERGEWEAAWEGHETRMIAHADPRHYPKFPVPLWRGEALDGRTLLVRGEQGIGDRIMFSRYIAEIKRRWPSCRILFCPYDDLINLFWSYRTVCELLPVGVPFPEGVDCAAFLASLPGLLGAHPGNVIPDPGLIKDRVARGRPALLPKPHLPSLKVGVTWTGNPAHNRNRDRSMPLEALLPLAEDPRVTLYSFQVGPGAAEIEQLGCADLVNPLGAMLAEEGWVGTGLALQQLDLLVSVDTAVAHLAGALGVPTLLMLHKHADWRWGQHGKSTLWYPTVKLLRQRLHGDWFPVLRAVARKLARMADERFSEGN